MYAIALVRVLKVSK